MLLNFIVLFLYNLVTFLNITGSRLLLNFIKINKGNTFYKIRKILPSLAKPVIPSKGAVFALSMSEPNDRCLIIWVVLKTDEENGWTSCTCT